MSRHTARCHGNLTSSVSWFDLKVNYISWRVSLFFRQIRSNQHQTFFYFHFNHQNIGSRNPVELQGSEWIRWKLRVHKGQRGAAGLVKVKLSSWSVFTLDRLVWPDNEADLWPALPHKENIQTQTRGQTFCGLDSFIPRRSPVTS